MSLLLYVATAFAALWPLRRVADRRALLVLALLPLTLTARAMFTGGVYGPIDASYASEPLASIASQVGVTHVANPSIPDVYTEFFPWNEALRHSLRAREWPLWSPHAYAGDLLAAAVQSSPYHPITLLGLLIPIADSITFTAAALYLLAALSMFLFVRELGGHPLFGAAAWMFSTHLLSFTGTALGLAVAGMPLVFLGARRIVREPSFRSAMLLLVALLLLVQSGHPETTLHVVAGAVAYFLFEAATHRPIDVRRLLTAGLGAGIGALLLSAISLLPMFEAIPQTEEHAYREQTWEGRHVRASAAAVAHRVRATFVSFAEGVPGDPEKHAPEVRHGWLGSGYCGAIVFAPALVAVWRRRGWFFLGLFLVGLLAGAEAPGVTDVLERLPGFSFAINDRMISFAAFGLCVLAALGLEDVRAPLFIAVALATVGAAFLMRDTVSADLLGVMTARAVIPLLLAAAACRLEAGGPAGWKPALLFVLLIVQRLAEAGGTIPTLPRAAWYPPFPGLEVMRTEEPSRMVAVGEHFPPNLATHYDLEDVRGYQALTLLRLTQTFPLWCKPQPVWFNRVDDLSSPFLSFMNVRFAITDKPLPDGWIARSTHPNYVIAENTRVVPRAFVPRVVYLSGPLGRVNDYREVSWIEADGPPLPRANGAGEVRATRDGSGLRIRANMREKAWVVVSNTAWRGWRARAGGRELPLHYANHAFLAFELPPGEHDVELFYRPRSFVTGAWISALALVALLAIRMRFRARP